MPSIPESEALPHWDLSNVYPGLDSEAFARDLDRLNVQLDDVDGYIAHNGIATAGKVPLDAQTLAGIMGGYLDQMNALLLNYHTLAAFIRSIVVTDSYNQLAKRALSELEIVGLRQERQAVLFQGWIGTVIQNRELFRAALAHEGTAHQHAFYLNETAEQSRYLMSEPEETLASELSLSGANAWAKLHRTITSQVKAPFERHGQVVELPISVIQNLYNDPDGEVRRQAYEVELKAWEGVREPLAASLNGIKGAVTTLDSRRGREDALHRTLDQSRMDRQTLEAMLGAMKASFPAFRRYWMAKAKRLGKERLPWWDLFAPTGRTDQNYTFAAARGSILTHFSTFSERLALFAERAFENNWIDAEPREGKAGGAFCMPLLGVGESRILCNFDGSLDQLTTLAHELGHAFHNECLAEKTPLQRQTPMTLAETASIFTQTLISEAALAEASSVEEELSLLESLLISSSQVIVDIYSRYLFESEVFERRAEAELSADDLCEIMVRCQRETYGDGVDERYWHPYMWAWKPHYYSSGRSFYNFPYAFGLLFGLGLYSNYQLQGPSFEKDYEALLGSTGEATPAELAGGFGIDIREPAFWERGIKVIERQIDRYVKL